MKRLTFFAKHSRSRHKLALAVTLLAAGSFGPAASLGTVQACDQCELGDIVCDSHCNAGCDSCGSGTPTGPVFTVLDSVAGGIEKFLGFDKCGSSCGGACCDAACDAATIEMMPLQAAPHHQYAEPAMPTVPPESYSQPVEPYAPLYSQPEPYAPQPAPESYPPERRVPETIPPEPEPAPQPQPLPPTQESENGGIFDTLKNPFSDDEVRWTPHRSIHPSAYQPSAPQNTIRPSLRYLTGKKTPATQTHQAQHVPAHHSHSSNVKHAATRQPLTQGSADYRSVHRRTGQHQPAPANEVRLSRAPAPRSHHSSARKSAGHRHPVTAPSSRGHSTSSRQTTKYLFR